MENQPTQSGGTVPAVVSDALFGVWSPIETAPKDGTHVLLHYPEYHQKVWVGHYFSTETHSFGKLKSKSEGWHIGADILCGFVKECHPTHWMPLPSLPSPNDD